MDDPFNFDPDASYSALSEVEKLDRIIQSDQCFIRCIIYCILYYIYIWCIILVILYFIL